MVNCVRHHTCMAFNYHAVNKTCIFLPEVECMLPGPDDSSGYVFVHLTPCKMQAVYTSVRPADHNWYWSNTENPNTDLIVIPARSYNRYVSRLLYRGYYLPGWWRTDGFRAIDPVNSQLVRCPYGEFLAFTNSSFYQWIPYVSGDAIPNCALPTSKLPDGTPLYIVRRRYSDGLVSGFYNPVTKSTYLVHNGVANPMAVDILCWTFVWWNGFNDCLTCCHTIHPIQWFLLRWLNILHVRHTDSR